MFYRLHVFTIRHQLCITIIQFIHLTQYLCTVNHTEVQTKGKRNHSTYSEQNSLHIEENKNK